VDKITGPGNAYVAEAKRQVFGTVGIDMIAGPSEILVRGRRQERPGLDRRRPAQPGRARHRRTVHPDHRRRGLRRRRRRRRRRPSANPAAHGNAGASWRDHGAVIVVDTLEDAVPLVDRIAPEHLEIAVDGAEALADKIRHAGAVFLGRFAPEAVGDYVAGPNHVLPTERSARFSSGLGVTDFMKRSSRIALDAGGLAAVGPAAATLARAEGLDAHALSVSIRLNTPTQG
jgi:histidinol dehydrogenase